MAKPYALRPSPYMVSKGTAQIMSSMPYSPNLWRSQGIKREIAVYGTTIEAEITGINWGKEVSKRAA
jgi:hypothetical protein